MSDPSRRRFLAQASAVATAPWLADLAGAAEPGRKLGVALCGLGSLSTNQIAPALARTQHCRLAGIVTGTPAKARQWQQQYGLPERSIYDYDNMHRMADNPDIDIVYVVTPNALHLPHAQAAAAAGKHVFCEKPLEISVARCQQMIDAVRGAGRLLGVAYRCQFEPNNLECVRLAREQVLGELRIIDAGFSFHIGDPTQWRLRRDLAGGGALMDIGVYCLQTTCQLTGEEPIWISAMEAKTDAQKFAEVDETVIWQSRFPSGVVSSCIASYGANGYSGYRAGATGGWFGLEPGYYYDGNRGRRSDGMEIQIPVEDQFALELDHFAECILTGSPCRVPGEMGLRDVRIMMAIYDSIRRGAPVELAPG
ncbi:MAG: Gfo/Idh/MocA family oxidoreductase [Xanthomonadales bacterium]|nr:Gfo/Idh/MocA family oxidoreductase [Xanthomonadales bacterium]